MMNKKSIIISIFSISIFCGFLALINNFSIEEQEKTMLMSHALSEVEMKVAFAQATESQAIVKKRREDYENKAASWREDESALQAHIESHPRLIAMAQAAEFFGEDTEVYLQFVDQFGEPVSGVKARAYISTAGRFNIAGPGITSTPALVSDAEGRVELKPGRAWSVDIRNVEKEGYDYKRQPLTFGLQDQSIPASSKYKAGYYKGTKDKPRIVKLWRVKNSAEPMIYSDARYGIFKFNYPYTINIMTERKYEGVSKLGDLIIEMNRDEPVDLDYRPLKWSYKISVVGGGLIETEDFYLNEAPETGYQSLWSISNQISGRAKGVFFERTFYVKSRNRIYSKVQIGFKPYSGDAGSAKVTAWVNPSGSRNLLYDPLKRIYPR